MVLGPWWWSSGQCARLLLRRSEFQSHWSLKLYSVNYSLRPKINKKGRGWPNFFTRVSFVPQWQNKVLSQKIKAANISLISTKQYVPTINSQHVQFVYLLPHTIECFSTLAAFKSETLISWEELTNHCAGGKFTQFYHGIRLTSKRTFFCRS